MSDRSPTPAELELYERACAVRERAYAPYSQFPVGAVLLADDGRTFEGVNVENGSIGLTICAERSACVRAVSEGARSFTAIGVATHDSAHTGSPCGACRQFLSEFGLALRVVYRREGEVVAEPLSALLPAAFELRGTGTGP
jgi:cytidine deaminase